MEQRFVKLDSTTHTLLCQGEWKLDNIVKIKKQAHSLLSANNSITTIHGAAITKMDSAGAWLLGDLAKKHKINFSSAKSFHLAEQQQKIFSLVQDKVRERLSIPRIKSAGWLEKIGKATTDQFIEMCGFLNFIGRLAVESLQVLMHPARQRWNTIAATIEQTGFQALPIIALLSFMIGVVIAYQMGNQLRNYGANVFIVDLLGLSVLREFGPLLTAIIVAGRTGSAFTAQLGMMKINQEIDALNTMGVTAVELLLLPRLIGLFIALPLLTIWADIFGVMGGMLMANNLLDVSWIDFVNRFRQEIPVRALIIGLAKAPVFAMLIGSIACFQGMEVKGSAESVGKRTTRSVVLAIFFIIVVDAIFSVLFSKFKL